MTATTMHMPRYAGSDPRRRTIGWIVVILVHAIVLWALVSGTARKGLELIKKPLEAAVIQEVIIPPPPPPPPPPKEIQKAPPKVQAPPPPYVPPPEVTPPQTSAPQINATTVVPTAPVQIAPPPPPAAQPAAPGRAEIGIVCPTMVPPEMPRQALKENITGLVTAKITVVGGVVKDVTITSGNRVFQSAVRNAVMQYKCVGDAVTTQEFNFKIE